MSKKDIQLQPANDGTFITASLDGSSDRNTMSDASDPNGLGTLPALKGLAKLADLRPVVVIDTREQDPLPIMRLETVRAGLQSGDYSFQGGEHVFAIERKSIDDLVCCCMGENRLRFEREMHRLRGFRFKRLLVVGTRAMIKDQQYRSKIKPAAVMHSLAAWECRFDLPVVFVDQPQEGAALIEGWAWWFARELVETTNNLLRGTKTMRTTASTCNSLAIVDVATAL